MQRERERERERDDLARQQKDRFAPLEIELGKFTIDDLIMHG